MIRLQSRTSCLALNHYKPEEYARGPWSEYSYVLSSSSLSDIIDYHKTLSLSPSSALLPPLPSFSNVIFRIPPSKTARLSPFVCTSCCVWPSPYVALPLVWYWCSIYYFCFCYFFLFIILLFYYFIILLFYYFIILLLYYIILYYIILYYIILYYIILYYIILYYIMKLHCYIVIILYILYFKFIYIYYLLYIIIEFICSWRQEKSSAWRSHSVCVSSGLLSRKCTSSPLKGTLPSSFPFLPSLLSALLTFTNITQVAVVDVEKPQTEYWQEQQ